MWILIVVSVVLGILILHGLVADFRARRIRRRIAPMTDADQRGAEVDASLGPRSRPLNVRRAFEIGTIVNWLGSLGRR